MEKIMMTLLVTAISCVLVTGAVAQVDVQSVKSNTVAETVKEHSRKEKMMPAPEVQLKRMTEGLQLTAEQQKQILPLLEDEYARVNEIRQDENLNPKQIQKKVEEIRNGTIAKMQSFMTQEQKKTHDMISKEIKANKQERIKQNRKTRIGTQADPSPQSKK